ncbi:unnamed protein product, partial [marine sediment metagenome]
GINIILKNRDNSDATNPRPFYSNIGHYDAPPYQYVRVYDPSGGGASNQGMNVRGLIMTQHVLYGSCTCCGAMPLSMGDIPKLRPGKMPDEDDAYEIIPEDMELLSPRRRMMALADCTGLDQGACEETDGCTWYNGECVSCSDLGYDDCIAAGCCWYDGICHGEQNNCTGHDNQQDCEDACCYWWPSEEIGGMQPSCHSYPPNFASPLKYFEHAEDALDFVTNEITGTRMVGYADRFG